MQRRLEGGAQQVPFPYIFHEQVQDNIRFPHWAKGQSMSDDSLGREARMEISMNDHEPKSNSNAKETKMNEKTSVSTIALVGKIVSAKIIKGTNVQGNDFAYRQLVVTTGNGSHWDVVKPRNGADKTTLSVFAKAKVGDEIVFTDCFLQPFEYNGKACVSILARRASIKPSK